MKNEVENMSGGVDTSLLAYFKQLVFCRLTLQHLEMHLCIKWLGNIPGKYWNDAKNLWYLKEHIVNF